MQEEQGAAEPQAEPLKVVLIDPDASARAVLRLYLASAGYEVLCAQDAIGGGHLVAEALPSLVICEARLPYMNGNELVAAMRSDALTRGIPVVLLSVKGEMQYDAARLGVVASLKKPVGRERLLELVKEFTRAPADVSWALVEARAMERRRHDAGTRRKAQ